MIQIILTTVIIVISMFIIFLFGRASIYMTGLSAIRAEKMDKAERAFKLLGNYQDSKLYYNHLRSGYKNVSDKTYALGVALVNHMLSDKFRSQLEKNIKNTVNEKFDENWKNSDSTLGDKKKLLRDEPYIQQTLAAIESIKGSGRKDSDFVNIVVSFFELVADNVYGHGIENQQCSTEYSVYTGLLLLLVSDSSDFSDFWDLTQDLDSFIVYMAGEILLENNDVDDLFHINLLAGGSIINVGEDD